MPTRRLAHFVNNTTRARDLVGLGQSIVQLTTGRVDGSDMYRSALVQAIAALDAYVHGIVLDRSVDILLGRRPHGSANKVGLHFDAIRQILSASTPADVELAAMTHIAERLSRETFQLPDDIGSALSMVGVSKIWSTAFPSGPDQAKTALSLVVRRRNRIVHQCDADPLSPGMATPLSDVDALDAVETVEKTVATIDPLC